MNSYQNKFEGQAFAFLAAIAALVILAAGGVSLVVANDAVTVASTSQVEAG